MHLHALWMHAWCKEIMKKKLYTVFIGHAALDGYYQVEKRPSPVNKTVAKMIGTNMGGMIANAESPSLCKVYKLTIDTSRTGGIL